MDGIYKIYSVEFRNNQQFRHLMGRIAINNGQVLHLEDHHHNLDRLFPTTLSLLEVKERLVQLQHNPYFNIVDEEAVEHGKLPHEVPDLEVENAAPEEIFTVAGEGMLDSEILEIWPDAVTLAGKKLTDLEVKELMERVQAGKIIMTPIEKV